jgi:hypothetical protein
MPFITKCLDGRQGANVPLPMLIMLETVIVITYNPMTIMINPGINDVINFIVMSFSMQSGTIINTMTGRINEIICWMIFFISGYIASFYPEILLKSSDK